MGLLFAPEFRTWLTISFSLYGQRNESLQRFGALAALLHPLVLYV